MPEVWRDAVGYVGFYEASDLGNIRRKGKLNLLAKVKDKDGYIVHAFCVGGKKTNVFAHQIVNETFNGPRPIGLLTRHDDGIRHNNVPSNLLWGTPKQNSEDMVRHNNQTKGVKLHLSKLTEQNVLDIRSSSDSQAVLSKRFGVTPGNISMIKNRITWKHI